MHSVYKKNAVPGYELGLWVKIGRSGEDIDDYCKYIHLGITFLGWGHAWFAVSEIQNTVFWECSVAQWQRVYNPIWDFIYFPVLFFLGHKKKQLKKWRLKFTSKDGFFISYIRQIFFPRYWNILSGDIWQQNKRLIFSYYTVIFKSA